LTCWRHRYVQCRSRGRKVIAVLYDDWDRTTAGSDDEAAYLNHTATTGSPSASPSLVTKRRRGRWRPNGMSPAPSHRAFADHATEHSSQMRLIAHPAGQRNQAHRVRRHQQQPLRQLHSLAGDVSHRCLAEASFECTREMTCAETSERSEVLHSDCRLQMRLDIRDGTADLPAGQPTLATSGRTGYRSKVFVQEIQRLRDAGF